MAPRGRPRTFDRTAALRRAMEVFWQHGYEGASLADLTAAMGINSPSLYAAFGCKEQLFREAVAHYAETDGSSTMCALNDEPTARGAVAAMLRRAAENHTLPGKPKGCFLTLGATNCAPEHEDVGRGLADRRRTMLDALRLRLERAIAEGELPPKTDARALATFYATVIQGMSIMARDGAPREALLSVADHAMAAWGGGG